MKNLIADVILGNTIDTKLWIEDLFNNEADHIIVLDYDFHGERYHKDNVLYISSLDLYEYIKKFDTVNYYKSLYAYPTISNYLTDL